MLIIGAVLLVAGIAIVVTFARKLSGDDDRAPSDDMLPPHTLSRPQPPAWEQHGPSRWADTPAREDGDGDA